MDFVARVETNALKRRDAEKMRMHGAQSTPDSISTPLRGKAIFRRGYTTIALTLLPREALVKGGRATIRARGYSTPSPVHRRGCTQWSCVHDRGVVESVHGPLSRGQTDFNE